MTPAMRSLASAAEARAEQSIPDLVRRNSPARVDYPRSHRELDVEKSPLAPTWLTLEQASRELLGLLGAADLQAMVDRGELEGCVMTHQRTNGTRITAMHVRSDAISGLMELAGARFFARLDAARVGG